MKKLLIIVADTNDGDYITSINTVTDEEIELIKLVVEAIKNFDSSVIIDSFIPHNNFPCGEQFPREHLGEKSSFEMYGHLKGYGLFDDLCPYGEHGIHTITEVKILEVTNELNLL